jgi:hypothetical protein
MHHLAVINEGTDSVCVGGEALCWLGPGLVTTYPTMTLTASQSKTVASHEPSWQ